MWKDKLQLDGFHFISHYIRCGCLRQDQCNIACLQSCIKQKCTDNWPSPRCEVATNCALWSPGESASLPVATAISIMFLDTLCSKKWYDMPHIEYVIHSLQWSTSSRIGRHSAGYNVLLPFWLLESCLLSTYHTIACSRTLYVQIYANELGQQRFYRLKSKQNYCAPTKLRQN